MQLAFQDDELLDADPDTEVLSMGATPQDQDLTTGSPGSQIYVEALREEVRLSRNAATFSLCLEKTIAHEMYHQLGDLAENIGGVVVDGCAVFNWYYPAAALRVMRSVTQP